MTNREFYTAIANAENIPAELVEFATNAIAKIDETNEKRKNKPSKTALENAPILEALTVALTSEPQTAAVLGAAVGISTQKASALLRQLVTSKVAASTDVKVPGKGTNKAYFLAPVDEVAEG
jgi:Fic family protein